MSSQLLGELLLDRHNFTIMTKYISKPENLKLMMNLLRDKSRNIQFEAFHVFKVSAHLLTQTEPPLELLLRLLQQRVAPGSQSCSQKRDLDRNGLCPCRDSGKG